MAGIKLEELETRDMLDVLHYLFEEDLSIYSAEHFEAKNKTRKVLYPTLLGKPYKYSSAENSNNDYGLEDLDDPLEPFDPNQKISREVKPYMPPTNFNPDAPNPFGSALREAPLG
jgi:hypothetical protein